MSDSKLKGWKNITADPSVLDHKGVFHLPAYSEFMPAPKIGVNPYGYVDHHIFKEEDAYGWHISELEEETELKPGMVHTGKQIFSRLLSLGKGLPEHIISGHSHLNLVNNPYWPEELSSHAGSLAHERYVCFIPFALSRTQDDKGRVNWTFFGGSEMGPEYVFWKSFYHSPDEEYPESRFTEFAASILEGAYGIKTTGHDGLLNSGFRFLPTGKEKCLPVWTERYKVNGHASFKDVKFLLTFKPFSQLPEEVKSLYLEGKLALLPFPGSLVFWGMQSYLTLQKTLPDAMQIPMLRAVARHLGHNGLRVAQTGWIHEPHPDLDPSHVKHELILDTFHRTHRWQRIEKHVDELSLQPKAAKVAKVLFSTSLDSMGLYDKPMARNCQLWTKDFQLLLNGPHATPHEIKKAEKHIEGGGLFGYRFYYPPMQAGKYDIFWHRPLIAYLQAGTDEPVMLPELITGVITANPKYNSDEKEIIELWPRLCNRPEYANAINNFISKHDHYTHQTTHNIITLLYHSGLLEGKKLPKSFARHLLKLNKMETLEQWMDELECKTKDSKNAKEIIEEIKKIVDLASALPEDYQPYTFKETASRSFEESWWNEISFLAHGKFINKDNADCVLDEATRVKLPHHHRDLEHLGDYFISRHRKSIMDAGMEGKAYCGELPFKWNTDFEFTQFGGWLHNKEGHSYERNILVVIPGKNRKEAVVFADHYDTAYMEDIYDVENGGSGARISAAGADDNYSASATLLLAAPMFLKLAKEGKLERDIWLLHLTGEEFPSDCMGARNFCKTMIEKSTKLFLDKDNSIDLTETRISGTFVMDMIGHNRDNDQDIFQISPGKSLPSVRLAYHAHVVNMFWNNACHEWNHQSDRLHAQRGKRITGDEKIPATAKYLPLHGEVRTQFNPFSSIYNTDGQIFSDMGIPVVLFMENYDLHRTGYHDMFDTIENIDLDYGAAFAAIAIETVARVSSLTRI